MFEQRSKDTCLLWTDFRRVGGAGDTGWALPSQGGRKRQGRGERWAWTQQVVLQVRREETFLKVKSHGPADAVDVGIRRRGDENEFNT